MGLLELLGIRKQKLAEGELLEALLQAHRSGNHRQFTKLCLDHAKAISAAPSRWQKPPEHVTSNPQLLEEYIQTIGMAGQLLRDSGHPELWNALVGTPERNPITIWENKLNEATSLANALQHEEAAELLINHLIDTRGLRGNTVGHLQALSQGSLGHIRFAAGKVDLALGHYEQALQLCREQKDREGVRVYLGNLYESQRFLGHNIPAADYAAELGRAWAEAGNEALAHRFTRLSQIVRAGEPLLRVVVHGDGKVAELDEVKLVGSKKLELHFWRNRPSLPGVTKRIERGKELAAKRQYDEALNLFHEAANIDPHEPDAHYQAGMVRCEQQLYPQAVEEFEACEKLAPGWYFCRSDLWIARRLALGAIPHEVFVGLRFLQDGPKQPKEQMDLALRMRPSAKEIPLFALLFGTLLAEAGKKKEALEVWRGALKGEVESDVQTRLLVALSAIEADATRRQQLLQAAAELNGNLIAGAGAALSLRSD